MVLEMGLLGGDRLSKVGGDPMVKSPWLCKKERPEETHAAISCHLMSWAFLGQQGGHHPMWLLDLVLPES